jgi:inosine-uridine nucleoside N-ribohydrolase
MLSISMGRAGDGPSPRARVPVLLDTDIGDDFDDALALALILQSPELDLRGITTVFGDAHTRALIVCRLLYALGRNDIPVASGSAPRPVPEFNGQMQYGLRPCFRKRPERASAVEFLYNQLKARPGELTLLAVGPLTNVAELLRQHPDCKPWIKRLVIMGGAVRVGYQMKPPAEPEWNIKCDPKAAQVVFASGVPLVVAPLDATAHLALGEEARQRLWSAGRPLTNELHALYQLWDRKTPILFDPLAAALCLTEKFCTLEDMRLEVDDKGLTRAVKGKPNARVATATRRDEFLAWYTDRLTKANPLPALPRTNLAKPVERGMMPNLVHVIEDYETDIERRWWLCGRMETKDVPLDSKRACRAVLTNDFDDLMGNPRALYKAVIFNPVPGPPMGKHTRLRFRCKLQGTDALRVQLYSLSKGHHRHLTLTGLPQGKWQALTVDMTQMRRPDGSGGPLSEDERIDDIQFYTDPDADLLIDDIVLYDAAVAGEKRPFPARLHFSGWFDTGKQGKEWPGDFELVPKAKPHSWRAAKSVMNKETGKPWLRVGLRGERPLGKATQLRFRYLLTGAEDLEVQLGGSKPGAKQTVPLKGLVTERWAEATADLGGGGSANEIRFLLPREGAELLVDDLLLYEPGEARPKGDFKLEEGYVSLFNGKDLSGWEYGAVPPVKKPPPREKLEGKTRTSDGVFLVEDGLLVATGKKIRALYTTRQYNKDFQLKFEFRASADKPRDNSGLFIRGPQLQLDATNAKGSLTGVFRNVKNFKVGGWNEIDVTVTGTQAVCLCNGELIMKRPMTIPATGTIGLQSEYGRFEFRCIRIKEMP